LRAGIQVDGTQDIEAVYVEAKKAMDAMFAKKTAA